MIIINTLSGNYGSVDVGMLCDAFAQGYSPRVEYIKEDTVLARQDVARLVVCGGDGTLNTIINLYQGSETELIYCPFGTLNETAHQLYGCEDFLLSDGGDANGRFFSYVLATGTFTPLGYTVKASAKKRFKSLAYVMDVFAQCKVCRFHAKLSGAGIETTEGEYSLLMVLDSQQCFGLRFNKLFQPDDGKMHLLTIKAPRFNGFFGLVEMFFPFFRAFFMGIKKPLHKKRLFFDEITELNITTSTPQVYCVDGERCRLSDSLTIRTIALHPNVRVVTKTGVTKLIKKD